MAQKILLRRGPVGNLKDAVVSQGELLLATGSVGDLSGPFITIAGAAGTGTSTPVGKIYTGATAPTVNTGSYGTTLNGLPFYATSTKTLYVLGGTGNQTLDLSGNLEGTTISSITASGSFNGTLTGAGSGSFSGSFTGNGSALTNISLGSVAAPGNDTEILFNNGGTISATSGLTVSGSTFNATSFDIKTTGNISGSNLKLTGNADISGNVLVGGNITIGDQDTDFIKFAGEISSSLIPDGDNEFDLGTTGKHWRAVYSEAFSGSASSVADIGTVRATTVSGSNLYAAVSASIGNYLQVPTIKATDVYINSGVGSLMIGTSGSETFTVASNTGNTKIAGTLVLTGSADFKSTLRVETGVSSSGWIYAAGALDVDGTSTLTGNVGVGGTLGVTGDLAVNTDKFTVAASSGNTVIKGTLITTGSVNLVSTLGVAGAVTVANDIDADDITIDGWGSVSASLASIAAGTAALSLDDVVAVGSTTTGSISVGGLTVTGDLLVQGTTTTIDSTTIQLGDNIIELNGSGVANGGLLVKDVTAPNQVSGSLLWDSTNDYWKGGASGSEKEFARFNADPTTNKVAKADANGLLVDSIITDDGSTVLVAGAISGSTITASTGFVATGLTGVIDTSSRVVFRDGSNRLGALATTDSAIEVSTVMGYKADGTLVATSVIDGGTF